MIDLVSPDGSPLAVYLAIPAGEAPTLVHDQAVPGGTVLELGSGPGRITRVLLAYGHHVTAVDDSAQMLAHVTGARRVQADLFALDLPERFDLVLAASHLINDPDPAARARLLRVCRRHVAPTGVVLLERYPPGWCASAQDAESHAGPVRLVLEAGSFVGGVRTAAVTYHLGARSWRQEFTAVDVSDDDLAREAGEAGLAWDGQVDAQGAWVRLRPG